MSTPSSIEYISSMLEEPQALSEADVQKIRSITESYPYFVPARYMQAGEEHKQNPFSSAMMNMMKLYMGNWLLFYNFLEKSSAGKTATDRPSQPAKEKAPEHKEPAATEETENVATTPVAQSEPDDTDTEEAINTTSMDEGYPESMWEEEEDMVAEEAVNETQQLREVDEKAEMWLSDEDADTEGEEEYADEDVLTASAKSENDDALILPVYTEDYFMHQGINVSNDIPDINSKSGKVVHKQKEEEEEDKSLMVIMSFSEWLMHFKKKKQEEVEETEGKRSVKSMWQRQKLAAALEEEDDEIPEQVFEMAVNSITSEENLASESLAEIFIKQGKYGKAIDMYRKLSLRNPQKNAYFARKIEELQKKAKTDS